MRRKRGKCGTSSLQSVLAWVKARVGRRDSGYQKLREDTQMRLSFFGSVMIVLALGGLALSSAAAQNANTNGRNHYSTCNCRFGYGGSCVPAVSCIDEGGRCAGSCVPPPESK